MQSEGNYIVKVIVNFNNIIKEFDNQDSIVIGNTSDCDFVLPQLAEGDVLKLIYAEKYNNYVLVNVSQNREILCNGKVFSKILVNKQFTIDVTYLDNQIKVEVNSAINTTDNKNNNQEPLK